MIAIRLFTLIPRSSAVSLLLIAGTIAVPIRAVEVFEEPIADFDRAHWAFEPLTCPPVPVVGHPHDLQNPIDRFIAAQLAKQQVNPLPEASRTTLLRRLKFDLVGLPPTPDEVKSFLADDSVHAYDQLVDRLLGSQGYGQRWAQHWLDLARFAETDGFEHDKVREHAWRYRDWVVDALNEDMPYDRFVQLQLAGDQIDPADPDAVIATAFCLAGPDMPDINSQDERRHNLLNEMTATVGSVLLGLQLGCAQCHDHKYDPISQADFYRMRAIFEPAVQVKQNQSVFTLKDPPSLASAHVATPNEISDFGAIAPGFIRIANPWPVRLQPHDARLRAQLARWITRPDHPLTARVIVNRVWQHHFGVGLSRTSSDFGVMGEMPTYLDLLDWLSTEFVRQGWSLKALHRLIVTSATYRRASGHQDPGWTSAQRELASQTFEASLAADPENEFLGRFPRKRLEGEIVRDAMLHVASSLNFEAGGPGTLPPLPPEMLKTLLKDQWNSKPDAAGHARRSIYVFARRNLRFPIFEAFDRPDANASCARRNVSTTATQSLLMLNSDLSLSTARRLAANCLREVEGDPVEAAMLAFLKSFGRPVGPQERQSLEAFCRQGLAIEQDFDELVTDVCLSFLNANEFIYVD